MNSGGRCCGDARCENCGGRGFADNRFVDVTPGLVRDLIYGNGQVFAIYVRVPIKTVFVESYTGIETELS